MSARPAAAPRTADVATGLVRICGEDVPATLLRQPSATAALGKAFDATLATMDANLIGHDNSERRAKGQSCEDLLRAQLRAGAHVLELARARVVALAIGLPPQHVKPGIGDPSAFKLREAR